MRFAGSLSALALVLGAASANAGQFSPGGDGLLAIPVQAQRAPNRNACGPGTMCWRQAQDRESQLLEQRQRERQLRQFGIDNNRNMRSNGVYPGYRDNNVQIFRPSNRLLVDPNQR